MATVKEIRRSIDLVEGITTIEDSDNNEVLVEGANDKEINEMRNEYVKFLMGHGHSKKVALQRFDVLLHEGPREGSPTHKLFNEFMNIGK